MGGGAGMVVQDVFRRLGRKNMTRDILSQHIHSKT